MFFLQYIQHLHINIEWFTTVKSVLYKLYLQMRTKMHLICSCSLWHVTPFMVWFYFWLISEMFSSLHHTITLEKVPHFQLKTSFRWKCWIFSKVVKQNFFEECSTVLQVFERHKSQFQFLDSAPGQEGFLCLNNCYVNCTEIIEIQRVDKSWGLVKY